MEFQLDVRKALDKVDNEDLLTIMWEKGLRGKTWRILNNLNTDLTASIKTKYGPTREIKKWKLEGNRGPV